MSEIQNENFRAPTSGSKWAIVPILPEAVLSLLHSLMAVGGKIEL